MPEALLIHGSAHGAWCWSDLIPALAAHGMSARALDLPMQVSETAPVTLNDYAQTIAQDIEAHGNRPTVLLGHSAGGYAITAAAEALPKRIAGLIYLCAYVPEDGKSLVDQRRAASTHSILDLIRKTDDGLAYEFTSEGVEALCHDCPPDVAAYVRAHLRPQPIAPQAEPIRLTGVSAALPRHYVLCEDDRIVPPPQQESYCADWPKGHVHRLPTGHSPYFAAPDALAALISGIWAKEAWT